MSFQGLQVVSFESRRAQEMETFIERLDGLPFVAPSVKERAVEDSSEALEWAARLMKQEFEMVILTTGTGLAYLRDAILTRYSLEDFRIALARTTLVSRGPKPQAILHEIGIKPQIRIPEPNTWREIVPVVAQRRERRISVQEYGRPNPEFLEALRNIGAEVSTVFIYRWELPEDIEPLREAIRKIAARETDVVIFTTSVQLIHLFEVASSMGLEAEVRDALRKHIALASVGPIMTAAMIEQGLVPDIVPVHPKMGSLVRAAAEQAAAVLAVKRT